MAAQQVAAKATRYRFEVNIDIVPDPKPNLRDSRRERKKGFVQQRVKTAKIARSPPDR
jgi:hypothetical protein